MSVRNFNCWSGSEGQYASSCQILCRSVKPLPRDIAILRFFKIAAAAIVDFLNFKLLPSQRSRRSNCVTHCAKFCRNRWNRSRDTAIFRFFQDGCRPPSWICDACVGTTHEGHLVVFITVPNLAGIHAAVLIICTFFDFPSLA